MPAAVLLCLRTSVVRTTLPCRGVGEDRAKIREAGMGSVKSASSRSRRASPSCSKSSPSNRSNDCPQTVPHDARRPGRLFLAGPIHCVQQSPTAQRGGWSSKAYVLSFSETLADSRASPPCVSIPSRMQICRFIDVGRALPADGIPCHHPGETSGGRSGCGPGSSDSRSWRRARPR